MAVASTLGALESARRARTVNDLRERNILEKTIVRSWGAVYRLYMMSVRVSLLGQSETSRVMIRSASPSSEYLSEFGD